MKALVFRPLLSFCFGKPGLALGCVTAMFLLPLTSKGASGTWLLNPVDDSFDNAANWSSGSVPGYNDTATFAVSNQTAVTMPANTSVEAIVFSANADAYQFTVAPGVGVDVGGESKAGAGGLINSSGQVQNFLAHTTTDGSDSFFQVEGNAGSASVLTAEPQRVAGGGRGYVWITLTGMLRPALLSARAAWPTARAEATSVSIRAGPTRRRS